MFGAVFVLAPVLAPVLALVVHGLGNLGGSYPIGYS